MILTLGPEGPGTPLSPGKPYSEKQRIGINSLYSPMAYYHNARLKTVKKNTFILVLCLIQQHVTKTPKLTL